MADVLSKDTLNDKLPAFMRRCAAMRYDCGRHDYGLMLADWVAVAMRLERDPAEGIRGKYRSQHDAPSSWPLAVGRACRRLGLRRTQDPLTGDIGVLRAQDGLRDVAVGAIRSGSGWFVLTVDGVVWTSSPLRIIAAWRVEPC